MKTIYIESLLFAIVICAGTSLYVLREISMALKSIGTELRQMENKK
jgi:hypothetical protein